MADDRHACGRQKEIHRPGLRGSAPRTLARNSSLCGSLYDFTRLLEAEDTGLHRSDEHNVDDQIQIVDFAEAVPICHRQGQVVIAWPP